VEEVVTFPPIEIILPGASKELVVADVMKPTV
jgi:hypothetical protein